jgi:molybdopterin-containing oxidoreductase family membrane subunit
MEGKEYNVYRKINRDILKTLERPGKLYYFLLFISFTVLSLGFFAWIYQVYRGIGVAGITHPVKWGVYITNFVFWVGIAHSGTLISAILYLFRVRWRTSIYRSAEAMTVFAIMTAGLFPLIHLGRSWFFYYLIPYPNQRMLWPNFKSPLIWDVLAVTTYFVISFLFLYMGLLPDIATLRDNTNGIKKRAYSLLSLGWQGTDREWRHHSSAYLFLAAMATPLVVSVHSIVSWDFAMSIVPGWHSTIFAPYFVAGAIHSGLAMVLTLLIPLRKAFKLEEYITETHFENLAKIIIFTGLIVAYSYATELFIAWYSNNRYEQEIFKYRMAGDYAFVFWIMVIFNTILPLLFFFKRIRTNTLYLLIISILINIGMWFERFVIIVTSLAHSYIPFSWGTYKPTWVELSIMAGSFGFFVLLFLLFVKLLPSVSISEVKETLALSSKEEE